jgi:hypothetical protein
MQQGSLPQLLSAESASTAAAQMRRRAAGCGIVRRGAECGIPQKCPGFFRVLWLNFITPQICGMSMVLKLESADC